MGPSKSKAIQEQLTSFPHASVKETVAALARKGMKVTANHVYAEKSKLGKKRRRAKIQTAVAAGNPMELLRKVHALAQECGGIAGLREILDMLGGTP